jgi:hypothetical protein
VIRHKFFVILALEKGLYKLIHPADRCDLSQFQVGLRLLQYLAVRGLPIPLLELSIAKNSCGHDGKDRPGKKF